MAPRFSRTWRASSTTEPPTSSPVWGDRAICPEMYSVWPALMAWLYGPIGAGALEVWMISLFTDITYGCNRSEERRVGKECRSRGWADDETKEMEEINGYVLL